MLPPTQASFADHIAPREETYTDAWGFTRRLAPGHAPAAEPEPERGLTLAEQFEAFHAANPQVYAALLGLALRAQRSGQKLGIATIYEHLRWRWAMSTKGDAFKLNNNWRAFYARLLMESEPQLAGYFETRTQHAVVR